MNKAAVEKALGEAKALVASLEEYKEHQECHAKSAYHLSLLELVDKCHTALEEPYDLATRWLENMSEVAALYVLLRIDAFEKLPAQGSIAAADLASECKVDASVITRAMRILVAKGIFKETDKDEYAHNLLSQAFRPDALGGFACVSVGIMNAWIAVPEYAKFHKPEELYDIKKSPFAFVAGHEGKTYYEVLDMDPKERALWNMTLQNMAKNFPVLGMFPFRDLEGRVKKELERPFIVDIGGGRGQALLKIREDCGGAFGGKLILQDLPVVIDTLKWEEIPGIAPMAYDIFTEQPVKSMLPNQPLFPWTESDANGSSPKMPTCTSCAAFSTISTIPLSLKS